MAARYQHHSGTQKPPMQAQARPLIQQYVKECEANAGLIAPRNPQFKMAFFTVHQVPELSIMREFKSEISASIFVCTLLLLAALALLLWFGMADAGGWAVLAAITLFAAIAVIPIYAFVWTKYFVNKHVLLIVCGPWTTSVPLKDIRLVQSVNSLLPAPALSSRRLQIHLEGGRTLMVSPQDARAFRRALGH